MGGFTDFFRPFVKIFKNGLPTHLTVGKPAGPVPYRYRAGKEDKDMKCPNCGKRLDEVDCACCWCTFCGTIFDVSAFKSSDDKEAD